MANYLTTDTDLGAVADAIRTKGGTSAALAFPADFLTAIAAIPSGGGTIGNIIDYEQVVPSSNATSANRLDVQLTPNDNCILAILAHTYPTAASNLYKAICFVRHCNYMSLSTNGYGLNLLMRSDGTIGTDRTMATFNKTTGVLSIGGDYGVFVAGEAYDIYQIKFL
ncbi:MAG: hypothetical protein IKE76_02965 [Clostridia bacterium]|nr:hypothetical protein [Clostridia bacterium]